MRVLQYHQDRLAGCQSEQLVDQRFQRPQPLHLRCEVHGAVAALAIEPDQAGDQRRGYVGIPGPREKFLQLVQPGIGRFFCGKFRRAAKLLDHRPERAVAVVGRALVADADMRFFLDGVEQSATYPGFTDTRFAHQ